MADKTLLRSTLIHQYTVPDTETEASSSVLYIIALVSLYDRDNRMGASKTSSTAPCIFSKAVIHGTSQYTPGNTRVLTRER